MPVDSCRRRPCRRTGPSSGRPHCSSTACGVASTTGTPVDATDGSGYDHIPPHHPDTEQRIEPMAPGMLKSRPATWSEYPAAGSANGFQAMPSGSRGNGLNYPVQQRHDEHDVIGTIVARRSLQLRCLELSSPVDAVAVGSLMFLFTSFLRFLDRSREVAAAYSELVGRTPVGSRRCRRRRCRG